MLPVVIGFALKHIDGSFAATDIDAVTPEIEKHVVGVAASLEILFHRAAFHIEKYQLRRAAENRREDTPGLIERHREVRGHLRHTPRPRLATACHIYDGDLTGIRDVHERAPARAIDLKTFGMRAQLDTADSRPLHGIEHGEAAAAVTDHESSGAWIKANVVGIVAKVDDPREGIVAATEQADRSIAGARDRDRVSRRRISDPLRFGEILDAVDDLAGDNIDCIHGTIAKLGDEKALAGKIDRHVVDPPFDVWQGDCPFKRKQRP
ncbi:MAG TPA: hypothetical protein VIJ78_11290 [Pseudolabrys sp.]